jgi:hypothetical protein
MDIPRFHSQPAGQRVELFEPVLHPEWGQAVAVQDIAVGGDDVRACVQIIRMHCAHQIRVIQQYLSRPKP